jgi:hypothetical protein
VTPTGSLFLVEDRMGLLLARKTRQRVIVTFRDPPFVEASSGGFVLSAIMVGPSSYS